MPRSRPPARTDGCGTSALFEGFVHALDEATLAFPDRRGNHRLDTLRNIVVDPRMALLFMVPGREETLRIDGRAHVSTAPGLLERFAIDGRLPVTAVVVDIEAVYFPCARALKRAGLRRPDDWPDVSALPSAGALLRSAIEGFDAEGLRCRVAGATGAHALVAPTRTHPRAAPARRTWPATAPRPRR